MPPKTGEIWETNARHYHRDALRARIGGRSRKVSLKFRQRVDGFRIAWQISAEFVFGAAPRRES